MTQRPAVDRAEDGDHGDQRQILSSSAVMAAGTVVSRASGFVRSALLVAALGSLGHADLFNIANVVPNMLYILLAGGVFNAVLVPQLVRAMAQDPDGGEGYTNRVMTLAGLFLGAVTVLLVAAAPLVMLPFTREMTPAARSSTVDFARYCLPQVFFYGMFVLVGQVLNARRRFGPMMWAPIANNVVAVAVLVVYLVVFGPATPAEQTAAYSSGQELLLGVGSTLGIALQLLILVPYLRSAGFTFRPRYDFRGTGLGHTLRLGLWTVAFVIVNQVAYLVVAQLAVGGTAGRVRDRLHRLLAVVPDHDGAALDHHRLAGHGRAPPALGAGRGRRPRRPRALAGRDPAHRAGGGGALRRPPAAGGAALARVLFGLGAGGASYASYVPTLVLFGLGLVVFTVHYLMLRGFYALEQTRRVFFIQCAVAATNIVAALVLVGASDAQRTSPALVGAYCAAYLVGAVTSYVVLARTLGDLGTALLPAFLVRLAAAVVLATAVAWAVHHVAAGGHGSAVDPGRGAARGGRGPGGRGRVRARGPPAGAA